MYHVRPSIVLSVLDAGGDLTSVKNYIIRIYTYGVKVDVPPLRNPQSHFRFHTYRCMWHRFNYLYNRSMTVGSGLIWLLCPLVFLDEKPVLRYSDLFFYCEETTVYFTHHVTLFRLVKWKYSFCLTVLSLSYESVLSSVRVPFNLPFTFGTVLVRRLRTFLLNYTY